MLIPEGTLFILLHSDDYKLILTIEFCVLMDVF